MENKNKKVAKANSSQTNIEAKKSKINQKELIITIVVLVVAIIVGFLGGKALYEAMYGTI